jgi:large subunit ribosomal protein L10
MAISKQYKQELVTQYVNWIDSSQALFLTQYTGLTVKAVDELRSKVRTAGGEFHIIKNTLGKVAFDNAGLPLGDDFLEGSTAIAFAFEDPPAMAKAISEFARTTDFIKIKGGYLGNNLISKEEIKSLANLPPMPVMQAQLLGTIMEPASRLVRTLSEPARQIVTVLKAYSESEDASVTA